MSVEETQAAIDAYLTALVAREDIAPFFSEDVMLVLADVDQVEHNLAEVAGGADTPFVEYVLGKHAVLLDGVLADRLAQLLARDVPLNVLIRIVQRGHPADAQLLLGEPQGFEHKKVSVAMITAVSTQQFRQWMILI